MTPATVARSALLALSVLVLSALAGAPTSLAQTAPQPGPTTSTTPAPRQANPAPSNPAPANPARAVAPPAARPANPGPASSSQANPGQANPTQANPGQANPTQAGQAQGWRGTGRRPRSSYAACNRLAHARSLRGGARRRFLIRCKLGYERPRQPTAPARQP